MLELFVSARIGAFLLRLMPKLMPGRPPCCTTLSIRPVAADNLAYMAAQDPNVLAASPDVEAVNTPTAIDADELAEARLDERWREFCLNAEQYVAETTRPAPRVQ